MPTSQRTSFQLLPEVIELCQGHIDGREFYAVLEVRIDKYSAYQAARLMGVPLNLSDYGRVLASGWGKPESASVERLRAEYTDGGVFEKFIQHHADAAAAAETVGKAGAS